MEKKPSKRILEMFDGMQNETQILEPESVKVTKMFTAISTYLDEEKQRVNEILHEIASNIHDGENGTEAMNYPYAMHDMVDEKLVDK